MAVENDPLLVPTWANAIIVAVIAIVSGVVATASTALLIALGITKKFADLEKTLLKADSDRFHALVNILQGEVSKSENADDKLSGRIGACEQDIAVLKSFSTRAERFMETHK